MERFISEKISSEEMTILDNNSEWLGIPKSHLMECAGYSFAAEIIHLKYLKIKSKVAIFCGTGNNGGDGFVIAKHLSSYGFRTLVILVGTPDKISTNEALLNWNILQNHLNYSISTCIIKDSTEFRNIETIIKEDKDFELIIDGLLGTGIKGKMREPVSSAIDIINNLKQIEQNRIKVASIDVPSGMDPNSGKVHEKAVFADLVITFHRLKKGMKPNSKYIKDLIIKSIGIPPEASIFVGRGDLISTLKTRKIDNHKGQFGRVLIIGGSINYSGAPAYTSLTAINFGCDLVITYVPEIIGDVLRAFSPNMIIRTNPGKWLTMKAFEEINFLIDWANSIVIGPGLGVEKSTEELIIKLLETIREKKKAAVLDADALKLVKDHLDLIKHQNIILTPHEGELKIMTNIELPLYSNIEERGKIIFDLSKELDVTLLVKGPYDYISNGKLLKINKTGCPEMSIGGTGDVLAGFCACFLTTENAPFQSACSAAFLNGYLGEFCKSKIGSRFTTMDMISNINNAIMNIQKN